MCEYKTCTNNFYNYNISDLLNNLFLHIKSNFSKLYYLNINNIKFIFSSELTLL